jgi:hypothetical protein
MRCAQLEGMCALMDRHCRINLGVHGCSVPTNLDENTVAGHEGHSVVSNRSRRRSGRHFAKGG